VWVAIALLITDGYAPTNLLLANKFLGPHDSMTAGRLWFVEVLVWILVALAVLCWLPTLDRLERRQPFVFAVAFLAAGLALRYDILGLHLGSDAWYTVLAFWFFAVSWAAAKASTHAATRGCDDRADYRPARLLRQYRARNVGAGRFCPTDLATRATLPARGHRRRRRHRGGVAVHLPHPLPGLPAVRRPSAARRRRICRRRCASDATRVGAAIAASREVGPTQVDEGSRSAISPSCVMVAAMAPSERIRLAVTTPRPRAAAGERHSSRFHSSARTGR